MYFNQNIEKYILGNMMYFHESQEVLSVFTDLQETDFESNRHRMIWRAAKELAQDNKPCDLISVHTWLEMNKIDTSYTIALLKEITQYSSTSTSLPRLIEQMKDLRKRRTLRQYACSIQNALTDSKTSADAMEVAKGFPSFEEDSNHMHTASDMVHNSVKRMLDRKKSGNKLKGITTGFSDIDIMTAGLQKKEMSVLGARPSIGKSVFAFDIARYAAKSGKRVVFFSLEMSEEMLSDRMLAAELMVKATKIKIPVLLDSDDQRRMNESNLIEELATLHICDDSNIDVMGVRAKCKELIFKHGPIDLIIVDYLQYMGGDRDKRIRVENNSMGLKQLAKDINAHVMCISSLSRANKMRSDERPTMSDLRESGQIEFDADVIMLMHRDVKAEDIEQRRITEIDFAKQRNGATGVVKLNFMNEYVTFKSLEKNY